MTADSGPGPAAGTTPTTPGPEQESAQSLAERQADRMYRADTASSGLGIEITNVGPGRATATMRVVPAMANGHGTCHGGYLFLLADTAFAFACNTYGEPAVAAGADVTFIAPVAVGDELAADALERVRRGRTGLYDVTVRRGHEVVAEFRSRSRSLSRPPARTPGDSL